jgi:hypothetical protein
MGKTLQNQPPEKNLPMWTMVYAIADSLQEQYPNFDWTRFISYTESVAQGQEH